MVRSTEGRASIRDVAERAGVSVSTVSRILNGRYPPAPQTRERVMRAVRDLEYVANPHARALTTGSSTGTIGMAVMLLDDALYTSLVQSIADAAGAAHRLCLIATTGGTWERELEMLCRMREQGVEAIVAIGAVAETEEYHRGMAAFARSLAGTGTRLVFCARPPLPVRSPATVEYDNIGGAYAATSHLLSRGHRRILLLGGTPGSITSRRREGYRNALADLGGVADPALEVAGATTRETGYAFMRDILAAGPPAFTGVFAHNDRAAAGAIQAIREAGLRVPEDISIVGFDNAAFSADLQLTTVHIPAVELGQAAVSLAVNPDDPQQQVMLGTHVVVRESVRVFSPVSAR